ncbi:MAG: hypothetical protein RMJ97_10185 [Raineya sp.]|nr:hypothetical protein [Raineya sp.]
MKNLKLWFVIGFNVFALCNTWHVESCAYFEPDWELYRFFNPELSQNSRFRPLYFSFSRFYENEDIMKKNEQDENLVEWQTYMENKVSTKDLEAIIYKSTQADWDKIRSFVLLQKTLNDKKLAENSVVQYWATQKKDAEAIEYLSFAKKCERFVYKENPWDETPPNAQENLLAYSREAEKRFASAKDAFIKLRYGYQAVRLAHYAQDFKRTILLYDNLLEPLKTENVVKYWALAHKAGALQKMGQNALSAYLFAVVFEKSTAKRISSFLSCKIFNDEDWKKALSLCKNNQEKTTLFFIRGIHPQNLVLPEMMAIYSLVPESDYLDMLLLREINKIEMTLMPLKSTESGFANTDQIALYRAYIPKLKTFVQQYLRTAKNPQKQALWVMALGYCDYLLEKPQEARKSFALLKKENLSAEAQKQMQIFETMLELAELNILEKDMEEKIYQKVVGTQSKALKELMRATFARLYDRQGEKAKAYLSHKDLRDIKIEQKIIDELIAFASQESYTSYEKELLAKIDGKKPKAILQEIKATLLLREGNLDEAEKLFKQSGITLNLEGDPTSDELIDCINCPRKKPYTKLQLINQIRSLEAQARKGSAEANHKLGNIYYNTTYFGHAWQAMDYFRSGASLGNHTDCSKAQEYYEKAAQLYEKAGNREMAARLTFLAAKAEQNQMYLTDKFLKAQKEQIASSSINYLFIPEYRTNFQNLKNKYRNTQLYRNALKECYYFSYFVR